jgi:ABC-type amino acid transport system permease subunit
MQTTHQTPSNHPPGDPPKLPPTVAHAADPAAAAPPAPERVGEYDLLEEIARGGMGVVYRARHRQLGRLVALKMILTGRFAAASEVQRFLVEAEAAAQLDHPGIVPIYEIGEHQGQRFFAMKLVEGGSLAQRLPQLRNDVRAGVALLAKVARAVQHAHERGILHRDLKPSNILIDHDGSPMVTDFGLAKHLTGPAGQAGSDLTQSGAIVGTPSYMAPEQAGGARQVTTAADVYSLGAILYELLTGRPPHVGPNALEIVVHLLSGDVSSPRALNPRVDRDLDVICMKCLAANPAERYGSAAALAADLERFLAGEAISLRASALATQLRSWWRENLRTAGRTLALGLTFGVLLGVLVWFFVNPDMVRLAGTYDRLPSVPRPWIVDAPILPSWGQQAGIVLLAVLLGGMGFVTAVVVRPTTRHAAVAAGLAVGFTSAIVAFTLSWGWGPLSAKTILPAWDDLAILSDAAFTRAGPGEPHPSDRLLEKYPDLQKVPERDRGNVLLGKIIGDMFTGLLAGLWWGIFLSLFGCLVTAVIGTVAAFSLLGRHGSVRATLIPYTELATTATTLVVLVLYYGIAPLAGAGIVMPEIGWLAAMLGTCSLGAVAIWRRWPVLGRVFVHGAWISVLVLFQVHQADYETLYNRAVELVQQGEWDAAAERFERILRRQPELKRLRFETAIVCLRAGDQEAYQRHCRELLDDARGTSDPRIADRAAKVALLVDHPLDLPLAAELADRAVRLRAGDPAISFFHLVRGMAAYRTGKHADAINWLSRSQQGRDPHCTSTAIVFEAMALVQLGRRDEARAALQRADGVYRDLMARLAELPEGPLGPSWVDVLVFQISRQEAEQVVNPL